MKFKIIQTNRVCTRLASSWVPRFMRHLSVLACFSLAMSTKATIPISDLPGLDNLPDFVAFGNQFDFGFGTVNGNVGVSQGGTFQLGAPATINGDLFLASPVTSTQNGVITGPTFNNENLTTEQNTVISASAALAGLTPDETITANQTMGLNFNVPAGQVRVVNLEGGLNLNDENITLTGGGALVLNIQGTFSLAGSASILGDPANIYVNYLGTSPISTDVGSTANGLLFNADANADMNGLWNGGLYSGSGTVSLTPGAEVNPVPEPKVLILTGFAGLLLHSARRRITSSNVSSRGK